jgi:hypothetical protein
MGFFSWKCAVSGENIANVHSGQSKYQSECYLITPEQTYYEPAYDGYGVFGGQDVYALLGDGDRDRGINECLSGNGKFDIKIVLGKHYDSQNYNDLNESEDCEYQGFFYDDDEED